MLIPNHHPTNKDGLIYWSGYRLTGAVAALGDVADYSGGNNTGSLSGDSLVDTGGISLGGTNGNVSIPTSVDLSGLTSFTIILDCYVSQHRQNPLNQNPLFIGKMNPTNAFNYWSFGTVATGQLAFFWYTGSPNIRTGNSVIPTLSRSKIAVVFITGDSVTFYINGVLDAAFIVGNGPLATIYQLCIGANNSIYAHADLDDIQIYNRPLKAGEIKLNFLKNIRS